MAETKKKAAAAETPVVETVAPAVEDAAPEVEDTAPTVETEKPEEKEDTGMVPVRLVYDDNHKRDLFVCVNGRSMRIKRGKTVMVPKMFAEAIENAQDQEVAAIRYSDKMAFDETKMN